MRTELITNEQNFQNYCTKTFTSTEETLHERDIVGATRKYLTLCFCITINPSTLLTSSSLDGL